MTTFKEMQQSYDNMLPPEYPEDDPQVLEQLQREFDKDFLAYGFSTKLEELMLKICHEDTYHGELEAFKKEAASWYQSELEDYNEANYSKTADKMRESNDPY